MKKYLVFVLVICAMSLTAQNEKLIKATLYNSGWEWGNGNYNGVGVGSDGMVYYVLCSPSLDTGGQIMMFNPNTNEFSHIADLSTICGDELNKTIPQGKVHVKFYEYKGKLFFGTHVDHYMHVDGKELIGAAPEGWNEYPGGHLLSYDLKTGEFKSYCTAPHDEGIITFAMDTVRGRCYGITWPGGYVFRYDVEKDEYKDLGRSAWGGESSDGGSYARLCRTIVVYPKDGSAWFTRSDGAIFRYDYDKDEMAIIETDSLVRDRFGTWDPHGIHMGYQWRQAEYNPMTGKIYAIHVQTDWLFTLDPETGKVELLELLASEETKKSGSLNDVAASLAFAFGPDGKTIYYFAGSPGKRPIFYHPDWKSEDGYFINYLMGRYHLITYDVTTGQYTDHGLVTYDDGTNNPVHINSMAISKDGRIFVEGFYIDGRWGLTELIEVENPLR